MLDRTLITIAVVGILYLLFKLIRVRQLRAAQRTAAAMTRPDRSQILYFSSAVCTQCLGQEKILKQIFEDAEFMPSLKEVTLKKYTIESDAELAQQWGIKTVPTTILLSNGGEVKQINNGLVSTTTLLSQLHELSTNNTSETDNDF